MMIRTILLSVSALALVACSPPAQQSEAPQPQQPETMACNTVEPNLTRQVSVQDPVAAMAAAADLRGGSIAPGTYDLASATRVGGATGWSGTRAVSLQVDEAANGAVTFNWAGAGDGAVDRWTATFSDTPEVRLAYSCGRMGEVGGDYAVEGNLLRLRLTDGANGALELVFERRA